MTTQTMIVEGKSTPANGVDPAVVVPAAVRAAAERAEQLMKEAAIANGTAEPEDDKGQAEDGIVISDQPIDPPRRGRPPKSEQASPASAASAAADANTDEFNGSWQHKYESMHGRFETANKDNRRLAGEIESLRGLIATMQTAPVAPTPPELRAESFITAQEASEYGEEFLDVVGRKAKESTSAEIAELKAQLAQLSKGVSATAAVTSATARERMLSTLDEHTPDWRELNTDQNFIQWLALPDAFSGVKRQELLNAAYEQNNTPRVAAFFNGFLAEEAAMAPASPATPAPTGKVKLESFAAPGRAKSAAGGPAPAEKPTITRAQVTQFYADVAAGKYRGRDDKKAELEAQIFSASNEGRLR